MAGISADYHGGQIAYCGGLAFSILLKGGKLCGTKCF